MYNDLGAEALRTPELHSRIAAIEASLELLTRVEASLPASPDQVPTKTDQVDEVALLRQKREQLESLTKEELAKHAAVINAQKNVHNARRAA